MKGIILAGGKGSRLYPMTMVVSKQLLPIYDKPLIYYPLSALMIAEIREILIISTPEDLPQYKKLLGNGSHIGLEIEYAAQMHPRGLADAFIIGETFIQKGAKIGCCLVLGDNVFYGNRFNSLINEAKSRVQEHGGAAIFGYPVSNPSEYGVVTINAQGKIISIEEKPENPTSNYVIPGLYFYDNDVVEIAKSIKPSPRGEIEISAINEYYLNLGKLYVTLMGRGLTWLDTGSAERMAKASVFVENIQGMQGFYISCIEEIAWRKGFITTSQFSYLGQKLSMTDYGQYILNLVKENV